MKAFRGARRPQAAALLLGLALSGCGAADGEQPADPAPQSGAGMPARGGRGPGPGWGPGPGRGGGPGPGRGPAEGHPHLACTFGAGALPDAALAGVREALMDEWKAEARYDAFASKLGAPFPRLERAEERHADVLLKLLSAHDHETPSRPATDPPAAASVSEACASSLEAEKTNVALYDRLLTSQLPDDVRCVYQHLRSRSAERHIPALQRCASGGS